MIKQTEKFIYVGVYDLIMITHCAYCGKELERTPSRAKRNCYCNGTCQMNYEYKNGIRDKNKTTEEAHKKNIINGIKKFNTNPTKFISKRGYWMIYIPGRGNVKLHHYIWEKEYGRIVPNGYVIHHKDLNKLNNDIYNLELMSKKEHHKLHYKLRKINEKGQFI